MMICLPPLLGYSHSSYWDSEAFICWLKWDKMIAYAFTLIPLVLGPTLVTTIYTYAYIFNIMRKLKTFIIGQEKEFVTALTSNLANPDHALSFVLFIIFWVSWSPCLGIKTYEFVTGRYIDVRFLHFAVFWLGIMNSCWKFIIYVAMSPKFRQGLRLFCLSLCCRRKFRHIHHDQDY